MRTFLALITAFAFAPAAMACNAGDKGAWIQDKVDEAQLDDEGIQSISKWKYKGSEVVMITPGCCDIPTELFEINGTRICTLGGGFTNHIDDKCKDFQATAKKTAVVWERKPAANN